MVTVPHLGLFPYCANWTGRFTPVSYHGGGEIAIEALSPILVSTTTQNPMVTGTESEIFWQGAQTAKQMFHTLPRHFFWAGVAAAEQQTLDVGDSNNTGSTCIFLKGKVPTIGTQSGTLEFQVQDLKCAYSGRSFPICQICIFVSLHHENEYAISILTCHLF